MTETHQSQAEGKTVEPGFVIPENVPADHEIGEYQVDIAEVRKLRRVDSLSGTNAPISWCSMTLRI